jgi:microcystin-dependent protein
VKRNRIVVRRFDFSRALNARARRATVEIEFERRPQWSSLAREIARRTIAVGSPYVGEIRIVAFNFAPVGWAFANGALMAISQNDVLYNLIGTTYGGDGVNTFALPDIQGRMPMHMGAATGLSLRLLGQVGGAENTGFVSVQIPSAPQAPISALAPTSVVLGSVSPFVVLNFIVSLFGIYPSQN